MKVTVTHKVRPSCNDLLKENERLFQETRDLERKIVILERNAKNDEERYQRAAKACDHWNSLAVEKTVELDEKCAAYADAMRIVRQQESLIEELNDQIAASESELKHANEVIMSINEQLERAESDNVAYLDRIEALEVDLDGARASAKQSSELAATYFEKWNALRQQDARANAFARALVSAIEKVSADDTAIVISEIE